MVREGYDKVNVLKVEQSHVMTASQLSQGHGSPGWVADRSF